MSVKNIESVVEDLPTKKTLGPGGFTLQFYQAFKEDMITIPHNFSRKLKREHFLTHSVR